MMYVRSVWCHSVLFIIWYFFIFLWYFCCVWFRYYHHHHSYHFFYYLHALLTFYSNKKIYIIIYQCLENVKFLLSPRPQALNEDQVFFFKTKIVFHVPDQDQSLETTCVLWWTLLWWSNVYRMKMVPFWSTVILATLVLFWIFSAMANWL